METQSEYLPEISESPNQLIALALTQKADPEILKKLMDLQERWESNQAKKAYTTAMTAFKQEAPAVLKKHDKVDFTSSRGRTAYNYANLGSIVQEISALLGKHSLSASWSTDQQDRRVTVSCHITHVAGHRESVTLNGPIDESGNKNPIQAVGSTVTYLQRYTLLAALGLATIEDDDDGRQGAGKRNEPSQKSATVKSAVDWTINQGITAGEICKTFNVSNPYHIKESDLPRLKEMYLAKHPAEPAKNEQNKGKQLPKAVKTANHTTQEGSPVTEAHGEPVLKDPSEMPERIPCPETKEDCDRGYCLDQCITRPDCPTWRI